MRRLRMITILLSRDVATRFGPRLAQVLEGHAHRLVHPDSLGPGTDGDYGVDAAFLSRDITGRSTKFKLAEPMQRFFDILAASRGLRWVQTHSAGSDRPVWKPIKARGVALTTAAGALAVPVAISAVGGLIALARRFHLHMDAQRRRSWEPLHEERAPPDLAGTHALVVGLGPIGGEIARLLRAVGLRVTGARPEARAHEHCDAVVAYRDIRALLPKVDWLVLACPLSDQTRAMIDGAAIASLPKGAHIVNVARGEVVVEREMIEALRSGHLGGAWLDVFEYEPLDPASPLWNLPAVMVSPHSSGHSQGNYDRVAAIFLDNLARFVAGQALRNVVPPGR
jgi:phosphoglycerate dehydrogenase-like enzyme